MFPRSTWLPAAMVLFCGGCLPPPPPTEPAGLGAACTRDEACQSGLCSPHTGSCVTNDCSDIGAPCDESTFCTAGCGRSCEAPRARGAPCLSASDDGGDCPLQATCDDGLVCGENRIGELSTGACVPVAGRVAGEPCGDDPSSCDTGLVCDDDVCR